MTEERDEKVTIEMIDFLDHFAKECQSIGEPETAGCARMSADMLRWSLKLPPLYGADALPAVLELFEAWRGSGKVGLGTK